MIVETHETDLEGNIKDKSNAEIEQLHETNEAIIKDSIRLFGKFLGACNDTPSNTCKDALAYISNASTKLNEYKPINGTDGTFAAATQFLIDKVGLECAKGDCEGCEATKTDLVKHLYRHNMLPSPRSELKTPFGTVLVQKLCEGFEDTGKIETCEGITYNIFTKGDETMHYNAKTDTAITPGKVTKIKGE